MAATVRPTPASARAKPSAPTHAQSTGFLLIIAEFLYLNRMQLHDLFALFNRRGDGWLSASDIQEMLLSCNPRLSLRQKQRCMKQVRVQLDKSIDGQISVSLQDLRLALQELQEDFAEAPPWAHRLVSIPQQQQQQQQQPQQQHTAGSSHQHAAASASPGQQQGESSPTRSPVAGASKPSPSTPTVSSPPPHVWPSSIQQQQQQQQQQGLPASVSSFEQAASNSLQGSLIFRPGVTPTNMPTPGLLPSTTGAASHTHYPDVYGSPTHYASVLQLQQQRAGPFVSQNYPIMYPSMYPTVA